MPRENAASLWYLTTRYGFHFLSLAAIVAFMLMGYSPVASVFWATGVVFVLSFLRRDCALLPYDLFRLRRPLAPRIFGSGLARALEEGST